MAKKQADSQSGPRTLPRLKKIYREQVSPRLMEQFGYTTPMQVPRLQKIVINMGTGSPEKGDKNLENALRDLAAIAGQKPVSTVARKAISNFKIREGMKVGCKVTLRGDRAYHFLDRLCTVVLPRIRDFQGLSASAFDGRGNYALGIKEQLVFPEIPYETFDRMRGMDVIICTSARNDEEAHAFLKLMGLPLRDR